MTSITDKIDMYLNEKASDSEIENLIRDHLSGTDKKVKKEDLYNIVNNSVKVPKKQFNKVFKELVDDDFLVKTKDGLYTWEM